MTQYNFDLNKLMKFFDMRYSEKRVNETEYLACKKYCSGEKYYQYYEIIVSAIERIIGIKNIDLLLAKSIEKESPKSVSEEVKKKEQTVKEEPKKEEFKLSVPKIALSNIKIENEDYESYFERVSQKISDDLKSYDSFYKIENMDKIEYDAMNKSKYGDKVAYRDMFYKKSLCKACYDALFFFVQKNDLIKIKFNELREYDLYADVFNKFAVRDDLEIYLASFRKNKNVCAEKADEKIILMLKFIFAIRCTYKDLLYKIFPMLTKNQIDYTLKRLVENKLIETEQNHSTRITSIIPTNKLDKIILNIKTKEKNRITSYEYVKNRTKNMYIASLVEKHNPKTLEELEKVFKRIPDSMLYKGTERMLFYLSKTDSRYALEYYYNKLSDIQNSLQTTIRNLKKNFDINVSDNLYKTYVPVYDKLCFLLKNCFYAVGSYGKYQDYATISLRSLANNGVYIYDIKVNEKEEYLTEQHFKILFIQSTEDYRQSTVCNKSRDCVIYMCSNTFENDIFCDANDVFFYDDFTRNKFLKNITSIKNRIRDNKTYFYSDARKNLARYLARTLLV